MDAYPNFFPDARFEPCLLRDSRNNVHPRCPLAVPRLTLQIVLTPNECSNVKPCLFIDLHTYSKRNDFHFHFHYHESQLVAMYVYQGEIGREHSDIGIRTPRCKGEQNKVRDGRQNAHIEFSPDFVGEMGGSEGGAHLSNGAVLIALSPLQFTFGEPPRCGGRVALHQQTLQQQQQQ